MLLPFVFSLVLAQAVSAPTALQRGLMALRDGKLAEARTNLESAVHLDPKNALAWVSLAETCRRTGDNATALDAASKAEKFGSNLPVVDHALASFYAQEGTFAQAAAMEEKYAQSDKADPKAVLRTAELFERAGDEANAQRVLKASLERHGADPELAFRYAQLLLHKLDFAGAEKAVSPALSAHPNDPQLILVAGVVLYGQRRFADAMDEFLKVIAIDPTIPQPYEFLGKMLEQSGPKLPEITKAFSARLQAAPDDALANLVLAKARLMNDAKDSEAESLLRRSLSTDPNQWEAHYELGVVLESKHDFKAAADELKRSIELDAKQPMPHYHLARVYDRLGEPDRAQVERKLHEGLSDIPK